MPRWVAISAAKVGLALPVKTMKSGVRVDMMTYDFRFKTNDAMSRHLQTKHGCAFRDIWQGKKDSNLRMPESKSGALTNLATPLHRSSALQRLTVNFRWLPTPLVDELPYCCISAFASGAGLSQSARRFVTVQTLRCQNLSCVGLIQKNLATEGLR